MIGRVHGDISNGGHGRGYKRFRLNFAHSCIILAMTSGRIQCPLFYFIANSKVVGMISEFTCDFTRTIYEQFISFFLSLTPHRWQNGNQMRNINLNEVWINEFKSRSHTFTSNVNRSKLMMLNGCDVMAATMYNAMKGKIIYGNHPNHFYKFQDSKHWHWI